MSVSGISFLSKAAASLDAGQAPPAPADTHARFANAMAGASKPAMKPVEAKTQHDDGADRSKAPKAKDDHDDDSKSAKVDSAAPQLGNAAAQPAAGAPTHDQPTKTKGDAAVRGAAGDASRAPAQATDAPPETAAELVDPTFVAPVLAALNEAVAAGQGDKPSTTADPMAAASDPAPVATPQPAPQPDAAPPLPTTAALMAARAAAAPAAQTAEAREATPPSRKARDAAVADKSVSIDSLSTVAQAAPTIVDTPKSDVAAMPLPGASQQLANGGADRQLDLAKQGAWLDGLARDIASTGDSSSTLRFQVAPQHLGTVQVEMTRGADGAAVTLTASSESARSMLADARPQLVADAKAQGIHIANAQVDVSADSRQSGSGTQPEQRHDPRGQTGFSSQMGSGGNDNGRSQTRSQPIAVNQAPDGRADASAQEVESAAAAGPADGMYA